ncbi:MAG TPA: ribonuclease P protein component, partial [Thermoanaerobaculia bacterium]|nr:ribonuclease P protein component [Thermoanaerobaculia bacterium]
MAERQGGPPVQGGMERLPREHTLRRSADYLRCYRRGRRLRGSALRLHVAGNELGHPRLGITASRKVGKAVVR